MTISKHITALTTPLACTGLALVMLYAAPVSALTSSAEIKQRVQQKITAAIKHQRLGQAPGERVEVRVSPPDQRLRLSDCAHAPKVTINGTKLMGRVTTKVTCSTPTPWSLYVPVNVDIYRQVLTTSAALTRGHVVTHADLKLAEHKANRLTQGYFTKPAQIIGKEIKRPLGLGQVVSPNTLIQPRIIHKGDDVMIMANSGSLSIRTPGVALVNGRVGQQINVQNKHSKRMIKARVVSKGLVEVVM